MSAKTLDIKIVGIFPYGLLPSELLEFIDEFDINLVIGFFDEKI